MSAPSSDRAAIRQVIRTLKAAGHVLEEVWDGEEATPLAADARENDVIDVIMATDQATLNTNDAWVTFVLGNEPFEVAADYSMNLEAVMDALLDRWEA
jgi:hypothetical protein